MPMPLVVEAPHVHYAGFWRRLVALIIDRLILGLVLFPISLMLKLPPMLSFMRSDEPSAEDLFAMVRAFFMIWVITETLSWLYFALFESSARQATPGKMALNIRVTSLAGGRVGFGRASGRYFLKTLSGLILCIGYLMAAFSSKKQALHDMIANTLVVRPNEGG